MAAELVTPLDHETGIPLPILPSEFLNHEDSDTNWHHAWHANSAPQLQGIGGRALRHSRVQLVRETDHNHGDKKQGKLTYHDHYMGPPLPEDDAERLKLCVISAAGFVPDEAIDLWSREQPERVRMTDNQRRLLRAPQQKPRPMNMQDRQWVKRRAREEYAQLAAPGQSFESFVNTRFASFKHQRERQAEFGLHHLIFQYDPLRTFLRHTVLNQDLSHLRESRVDEFLLTSDKERKMRLGRWLLGEAVQVSTGHIREPYKRLHRAGNLHPQMPKEVSALVVWKLGLRRKRNQLVTDYENALRTSLGLTTVS